MPKNFPIQHPLLAENEDLRERLEKAEETLREILSGEADALFVQGVGGRQVFTLKGADQSYRTLIESMSEGALKLTPEGVIVYANRRFAEMLRTPLEKVIGSEIHTWFAPESRRVLQNLLRKDAVGNRREELALAAADGTQVPVYLSVNRILLDEMPDAFCMVATDLTEQKRNEAMRAGEELARAILEQAADTIVICDETGQIIRASKQAQAFYGKDLLGQLFEHAFPLRQLDGSAFSPLGAIDPNRRQSVEARLEHHGQWFDLLVSVGHLKGARSELLGSVVTLTDITAGKRAAESLRVSEWRFRQMADNIRDVFFLREADSNRMLYVSLAYEEIWGRSCDSLYANPQSWSDAIHPDDRASADEKNQQGMLAAKFGFEYRIVRPDGSIRWIETRGFPVRDAVGKVVRVAGVVADITERKHAAQELRESERRFSDMLGNVELVAMMLDCEAQITYCNEYLLRLTGWRHEEVIGRDWFELFIPPESHHLRDVNAALLANNPEAWHHENEILTRSGERRLIRWNNSVLRSGADNVIGTASIGEDITERKRAEIRIKYLNRVYAMLSGINTLIVRVRDRDELFREACRIAVDEGGFRMAMLSLVDRSAMKILPVASAGVNENLLSAIKARLASSHGGTSTMIAQASKEKRAIVSNDSRNDPRVSFGKGYAEAGVRSMAILPLIISNEAMGVLALYAEEAGFFDEEENKLLTDLAGDIAFAIDHIDKQERLDYLAYYDAVTGLANRALFHERMQQSVVSAHKQGRKLGARAPGYRTIQDHQRHPGPAGWRRAAQRIGGALGGLCGGRRQASAD